MQQDKMKHESEVLHHLAFKLASEVQPTYEPDDGLPTKEQMTVIRKAAGFEGDGKVLSELFESKTA